MDQDPVESSPERAVSSEPCSTHPHPFDDNEQHSARKRQKTSRSGSRSKSVDITKPSNIPPNSMSSQKDDSDILHDPHQPSTPTRPTTAHSEVGPSSSRVTINLRTPQPPLESVPSDLPSPNTPSKMTNTVEDEGARISIESGSDILSTVPASVLESPSPSSSAMEGSPEIELVSPSSNDPERSPTMAIIDDEEVLPDPLNHFPTQNRGETMLQALKKVSAILQWDPIETEEIFERLRDWIDQFLRYADSDNRLHGAFTKYRDFWNDLPGLIYALHCRSRYFGQFMQRTDRRCKSLVKFLYQYAKLSGRFLAMDVKTLSYSPDQNPDLASIPYLSGYAYLQRTEPELHHLGKNLETYYNWKWEEDTNDFQTHFEAGGGSMSALTKYVEGHLRLIPRQPGLFANLSDPSKLMERMNQAAAHSVKQSLHDVYGDASRKLATGYEYFNVMSAGLESFIEKNATNLTPDAANTHINSLAQILYHSVWLNPRVAKARIETQRKTCPDVPDSHLSKIISLEWKFSVLVKLITSAQMQLRVVGVTTMCGDLLNLHGNYRPKEGHVGGLVLYHFAKLILHEKIIDYLVGIGSHPEIINETSNIVGFLIVTKTYEDEQTDTIWQTVMTSQDPRVVEAILRMVTKIINLYDYSSLLYFCRKVAALPIQAFTVAMRDFCENLFRELSSKLNRRELDAPPYDICVRLIRESSITSNDCPNGYPKIQNFAASHLGRLLNHGPGQEARREIYLSCIKDISDQTATAPGSICVISTLLHKSLMPDLQTLTREHGLTRLMVDELESNISGNRSLAYDSPANIARRQILLQIILKDPDTINAELGTRLWNLLVGVQSNDTADRRAGWQILNSAFQEAKFSNRYLSTCFQKYLPKLEPNYFVDGTLLFVKSGVYFCLDEKATESQQSFDFLAMKQLWRIIETAPQGSLYESAIQELVDIYVGPFIRNLPVPKAQELHLEFLSQCLKNLADAADKLKTISGDEAGGDDEDMVIVIPESQIQQQELLFTRSLAALQKFLAASSNGHFATPKSRSAPTIQSDAVQQGTPLTIMYQAFDETASSIKKLTINAQDEGTALLAKLQKETDFTSCRVFCSGKEFSDNELNKKVEDLNLNGLVLVKRRDETDLPVLNNNGPLQSEITKNFDQLWSYLGLQEDLAEKIYLFLIQFPVYDKILKDLSNSSLPYTEVFPLEQPYKALYGLYVLKQSVSFQSPKGSVDDVESNRALTLLIATISDPKCLGDGASQAIGQSLIMNFVGTFASLLQVPDLPLELMTRIDAKLLNRLLDLLYTVKSVLTIESPLHLLWTCIEALLEVAKLNPTLWGTFIGHLNCSSLLQDLLLRDLSPFVRKTFSKQITMICTFSSNTSHVSKEEVNVTLWPMVAKLIPEAVKRSEQSEETFSVALIIFKELLALENPSDLDLNTIALEWGDLLLGHDNCEDVGVPEAADVVTRGLVNLLKHAVSTTKEYEQKLSCGNLGVKLFKRHLFPPASTNEDVREDGLIVQKIPLLNSITRKTMGETIFALVKNDINKYTEILHLLLDVLPYHPRSNPPYLWNPMPVTFERSKYVRSPTGYVGMRNLSNTCYLNSLVTQLFMNVSFREFILDSHIAVPSTQKLLVETQQLFSFMQNSMERCVDPSNFAASIPTFEELEIDVSVQMDVDEFYNLLFDRFERENLTDDDKRKVRSFYGGKLVQQIKSKECPHISGQLEDFSAIQCDIKGKTSLQESLQAYVEGEAMEGDNKYKCESCGRHVDAVKRACLKDIPDNLIFHLKRFDYNLRTLTRSKINDHFSFPPSIDMRPYKVEYLMNESGEVEEDMFELVGVLVHTGTAETGHYYSYIRERPQVDGKTNWMEFNDDAVTSWDHGSMGEACYGGLETPTVENPIQFEKNYSAYMLFYQRSSTLTATSKDLVGKTNEKPSNESVDIIQAGDIDPADKPMIRNPLKVAVNARQANHIILENELIMRRYCLYDPAHVLFSRVMFENTKHLNNLINEGKCSESHDLEKSAMWVAMCHLDQIVARSKDAPDMTSYVGALRAQCQYCGECSRDFLEYLCRCIDSFRFLLLKSPESLVRSEVSKAVLGALVTVKNGLQYAYGLDNEDRLGSDNPNLLQSVAGALVRLYEHFHNSIRAWPEYFGLLGSISSLGEKETAVLLDCDFLSKTLEIICADSTENNQQIARMLQAISKRNTVQRPVAYDSVIDLLDRLLSVCDPTAPEIGQSVSRLQLSFGNHSLPFTWDERHKINCHWTKNTAHILTEKLLIIDQNQHATKSIIGTLLKFPPSHNLDLDRYIYCAIVHGIRRTSALPWGSFLRAAILYCEKSENPKAIQDMASHVAKNSTHIGNNDGLEYLKFFKDLVKLETNSSEISKEDITRIGLVAVPQWAPALLTHYDSEVRSDAEDFLGEFIFNLGTEVDMTAPAHEVDMMLFRKRETQKLGIACLDYIYTVYVRQRVQAVRIVMINIENVTRLCCPYFDSGQERDRYKLRVDNTWNELRRYMVEEVEESEWVNSDDEYGSDEPMDNITELMDSELEVQL